MSESPLKNWAANYTFTGGPVHQPESVEELQELVARSTSVKALGTRHSFNDIADSRGTLISMAGLNRIIALDQEELTVTVEAGVQYDTLNRYLHQKGYALHNLASLVSITVGGACITGTHGSGNRNGNLATAITAIRFLRSDGELAQVCRRKDRRFDGMLINLGALGIVTELTLRIEPTYMVRQEVFKEVPFPDSLDAFDELTSAAYSVCCFTDWRAPRFNQVWAKQRDGETTAFRSGGVSAETRLHPIESLSAATCTEQLGIPGPWHERLPHFMGGSTPSHGDELQTEYFVPRTYACDAIQAVYSLRERIAPLLYISEVRTVAADTLWLSPCYEQDCVGIHFTWRKNATEVMALLPLIEEQLKPFGVRPHWGKLFTLPPTEITSIYPRWSSFCDLVHDMDPEGMFRNAYLDALMDSPSRP